MARLVQYLVSGAVRIQAYVDLRHRELLLQIREQDLSPCPGGWIIRQPEKYMHIPEIRAAIEDYQAQMKLAIPSSTACSGSSSSPQD